MCSLLVPVLQCKYLANSLPYSYRPKTQATAIYFISATRILLSSCQYTVEQRCYLVSSTLWEDEAMHSSRIVPGNLHRNQVSLSCKCLEFTNSKLKSTPSLAAFRSALIVVSFFPSKTPKRRCSVCELSVPAVEMYVSQTILHTAR